MSKVNTLLVRINLNLDDGRYIYAPEATKRKIREVVKCAQGENANMAGRAKVIYGRVKDNYTNMFDFTSADDLLEKIMPCLEKELIQDYAMA